MSSSSESGKMLSSKHTAAGDTGAVGSPPARSLLQSVQASRAVAAILVLLFHLGGTFGQEKYFGFPFFDRFFGWGDAGADLFFVLSGFIITTTHRTDIGRPQRLSRYIRRRLTRIYPDILDHLYYNIHCITGNSGATGSTN